MVYIALQSYGKSSKRLRRLISAVPYGTRTLLDVGCGDGFITSGLVHVAENVVGIDLFRDALAKAKLMHDNPDIAYLQIALPGYQFPFRTAAFDVVTAFEVIEHCREPGLVLNEIWRVLKPGGYLLLTTPNYKSFQRRLGIRRLRGLPKFPTFPVHWAGDREDGTHFHEFEPSELTNLLYDCGFVVENIRGDFVGLSLWRGRYTILMGSDWLGSVFPGWSHDLFVRARREKGT